MKALIDTPEKLILRTEANESLANAIRRSVDEVKVLAIDEVEFFKNDSALYDEIIALRIGLVPLKTSKKMSDKSEVQLSLKKSGPCTVYSGDLKGDAEVVYDNIPITNLEKGQDIEIVGTAKLGKAISHSKYVPGLFYYRHLSEVKSSNSKVAEIIEHCKGLVKEKKGSSWIVDLKEVEEEEIFKIDKEATRASDEMLLIIESFGQISAREILNSAIEALQGNLSEIEKSLK